MAKPSLSPVFEAMFYGTLAEKVEEIRVPDIKPEIFKQMLIYIYSEKVELTSADDARDLTFAADKYMLGDLRDKCITYWCDRIDASNVLKVMHMDAPLVQSDLLDQACLKVVQQHTKYVIHHNDFKLLPVSTLELILRQETLSCEEYELVMSVERWAEHQINLKDLPEESLRDYLEPLVPLMRFKAMPKLEFESGPGQSTWLTEDEKNYVRTPGQVKNISNMNNKTQPRSKYVSSELAVNRTTVQIDKGSKFSLQLRFQTPKTVKGVRMYTQNEPDNTRTQYNEKITFCFTRKPKGNFDFPKRVLNIFQQNVSCNCTIDFIFKNPVRLPADVDMTLTVVYFKPGTYPVDKTIFSTQGTATISLVPSPIQSIIYE